MYRVFFQIWRIYGFTRAPRHAPRAPLYFNPHVFLATPLLPFHYPRPLNPTSPRLHIHRFRPGPVVMAHALAELIYGVVARPARNRFKYGRNLGRTL